MNPIPHTVLDRVLALQLGVAWAGEGRCKPARLGWWDTDLVDEGGGGYLLSRLLPRTHAWASLQAALEAARRCDKAARTRMADPDSIRTLFHLGFEVDEQLAERLQEHKRAGRPPSEALKTLPDLAAAYATDTFEGWLLAHGKSEFKVDVGSRALKGAAPDALELQAVRLAAALVPLVDKYPTPFYRVGR